MRNVPVILLSAGNMASASLNSLGLNLDQTSLYSIQAVFTGSPVGVLKLQISNDDVAIAAGTNSAANVTHWTDYTGSSYSLSAAGDFAWNVWPAGYRWIRAVYTKTSGTGSLTITYSGKG